MRIRWLLYGLAVLAGALLGARLAFVLEHVAYYSTRQNEILNFRAGGLWWPGAAAFGMLVILVIGILRKHKILETFDKFSVFLLPLALSFWLAAWSAGVAYGARLDPSVWWGMPMLDISGVTAPRVPVQPAAALTLLLLLGAIEWMWKKPAPVRQAHGRVDCWYFRCIRCSFRSCAPTPSNRFWESAWMCGHPFCSSLSAGILLACTFDVKSRKNQVEKEITA